MAVDWWRSLYLRNALGLEDETLQWVSQYVRCTQGNYSERMMRYAIDGDDEAVLAEIVEIRNEDHQNFLVTFSGFTKSHESRLQLFSELSHEAENHLFSELQTLHPLLCYRLAKLNEALSFFSLQPLGWLHQLLARISPDGLIAFSDITRSITLSIEASFMAQILEASAESAKNLAEIVFFADPDDYHNTRLLAKTCSALKGFSDYSIRHSDVVREALQQKQSIRRNFVLEILIDRQVSIEPFLDLVIKLALSTRKGERELSRKFLKQNLNQSIPYIQEKATNGKTSERDRAIHLLWTLQGDAASVFLEKRLQNESDEQVRQSIQMILTTISNAEVDTQAVQLPAVGAIAKNIKIPETVLPLLQIVIDTIDANRNILNTQDIFCCVENGSAKDCIKCLESCDREKHDWIFRIKEPMRQLIENPDLNLLHAFRALIIFGYIRDSFHNRDLDYDIFELLNCYHRIHPNQELRDLAAVLEVLELDPNGLGVNPPDQIWQIDAIRWGDEATWPYFYERPHLLAELLNGHPQDIYYHHKKQTAFRILQLFPQLPASLLPLLWTIALGTAKTERPLAQQCLNHGPNTTEQLLETIHHPDAAKRAIAAEWLANRHDTEAIAPLKDLLRKEKSDAAKVAVMRSLERLGAPIDEFLNRDQLLTDAQKGLAKGIPEALTWFPFADLPPVHWADNHQPVDSTILTWLIVQSYKQKSPEPSPLLQRYAQLWKESDRPALGNFVLNHWITQDTAPLHTQKSAEALAHKTVQTYGQYYPNKTKEQLHLGFVNSYLKELKGSANKEKGILAIASACCIGATVVPIVKKYLDTWYGNRATQCNALLQMLSWIEDAASIQYLLAVANRFRTNSIQKEAHKFIQAIADRHQWTPDELGDRTIPTAGFSVDRTLLLDYGSRQFTLTLDLKLNPILKNAEGKVIKALPNANQQDDPAQVEAAKAAFSLTKKELKQVLQIQKTRLYEAMAVQRSWYYRDWELLLNQHPIVGLYTQSLVWAVFEDDTLAHVIRPLGDGTLTTLDDREVTLPPDVVLRLAHTSLVSEADAQAWKNHLDDYEVIPPFEQFWAGLYNLPSNPQTTDLNDFHNHTLEAFHLRGRATKRGYNRGPTGDGGYFGTYHKTFASLGIEAIIDFSGNSLPEQNVPVQLYGLSFSKPSDRTVRELYNLSDPAKLPLRAVPPVLLQECWNDLRHIVAE